MSYHRSNERGHARLDIFQRARKLLVSGPIVLDEAAKEFLESQRNRVDLVLDKVIGRFLDAWQAEAGMKTYGQAIADVMRFRTDEGESFEIALALQKEDRA